MISLAMIVILVIVLFENFNFIYYEAKLDGLTGLLGRRQFFHVGNQLLKNAKAFLPAIPGCFVILDVDHFKEINDTFGNPTGDKVLKSVAENLQDAFRGKGVFGRLGGDEFVAFIPDPVPREEVEKALEQMKERIRDIIPEPMKVTCSIGVIPLERTVPWMNCTVMRTGCFMKQRKRERINLSLDTSMRIRTEFSLQSSRCSFLGIFRRKWNGLLPFTNVHGKIIPYSA